MRVAINGPRQLFEVLYPCSDVHVQTRAQTRRRRAMYCGVLAALTPVNGTRPAALAAECGWLIAA